MIDLVDKPIIREWWKEDFKSVIKNGNQHIETLIKEGYIGKGILKKGVIPRGQGSVVYYIETSEGKVIVKFFHKSGELFNRKYFFDKWSEYGVQTPKILGTRVKDEIIGCDVGIFEYIDSETLSGKYSKKEIYEKGYYKKVGGILAKIHKAKGKDYGKPKEAGIAIGEFKSFKEDEDSHILMKCLPYIKKNGIELNNIEDKYNKAISILVDNHGDAPPSLCHNDFSQYNIFDTEPLTVFDPACKVTLPMKDLGTSLSRLVRRDREYNKDAIRQYLDSYEKVSGELNIAAVNAGVFLAFLRMLPIYLGNGDKELSDMLIEKLNQKEFNYIAG